MFDTKFSATGTAFFLGVTFMYAQQASESRREKKQYFISWASYQIPMRPTGPVTYIETEWLVSYYLGKYDTDGNLVRFTKFLRELRPTGQMRKPDQQAPKAKYFEVIESADNQSKPGREIPYSGTEGRASYFRVLHGVLSQQPPLELVLQTVFFEDEYSYWPNKTLKSRVTKKEDGTVNRREFDSSGKELVQQYH